MLAAVERARVAVPRYGSGPPLAPTELRALAELAGLRVHRAVREMDAPAVLLPPFGGAHRLVLNPRLGPDAARFVVLHEIGHVLAGDAEEIILLRGGGGVPEAERVADAFALLGFFAPRDRLRGAAWIEGRLARLVPLDDPAWRDERLPRLARRSGRLTALTG